MERIQLGKLQLSESEAIIAGDPCYFDDTLHACYEIANQWGAGEYPVYVEIVDGGVEALYLMREQTRRFDFRKSDEIGWLGVDSGQLAFAAASIIDTWTESGALAEQDFEKPVTDYDAACHATLHTPLQAGHVSTRLRRYHEHDYRPVATAFASRTKHGDGEYPLCKLLTSDEQCIGYKLVFDPPYPDDEYADSYWDDEVEYED